MGNDCLFLSWLHFAGGAGLVAREADSKGGDQHRAADQQEGGEEDGGAGTGKLNYYYYTLF